MLVENVTLHSCSSWRE